MKSLAEKIIELDGHAKSAADADLFRALVDLGDRAPDIIKMVEENETLKGRLQERNEYAQAQGTTINELIEHNHVMFEALTQIQRLGKEGTTEGQATRDALTEISTKALMRLAALRQAAEARRAVARATALARLGVAEPEAVDERSLAALPPAPRG